MRTLVLSLRLLRSFSLWLWRHARGSVCRVDPVLRSSRWRTRPLIIYSVGAGRGLEVPQPDDSEAEVSAFLLARPWFCRIANALSALGRLHPLDCSSY